MHKGRSVTLNGSHRKYLANFVNFCDAYFSKIIVWSAGEAPYVHSVVENIFYGSRKPDIVYSRDKCMHHGNTLYKPLKRLYDEECTLSGYDHTNTLVLDDRETTFIANPDNGVQIPNYNPDNEINSIIKGDDHLYRFACWLMLPQVLSINDMRTVVKSDMFLVDPNAYSKYLETNAPNNHAWLKSFFP
jgi:hypothetical protein